VYDDVCDVRIKFIGFIHSLLYKQLLFVAQLSRKNISKKSHEKNLKNQPINSV